MKKYVKIAKIVLVIGAVIYGINPADLVADIVPLLGYVDDIAVALVAIAGILGLTQVEKKQAAIPETTTTDEG